MSMAHIATRKALTLAGADMVAQAAEAEALGRGARVVIAVVDGFGKPIVLRRLDPVHHHRHRHLGGLSAG